MRAVTIPSAKECLAQRLTAAAEALLDSNETAIADQADESERASALLNALISSVHADRSPDRLWLLVVAMSGSLPTREVVEEGLRHFELADVTESAVWLLNIAMTMAVAAGSSRRRLRVVTGGVLVDVDHSARSDLHTGIQQVVRRTIPRWVEDNGAIPVAWTRGHDAYRTLTESEFARVTRWYEAHDRGSAPAEPGVAAELGPAVEDELIVPWHGVLVLAEVPGVTASDRIVAIACHFANRVVAIGYDCIPILSADMVPADEPNRFGRYLTVIKWSHRVAAISVSAATEFGGFAEGLAAQGLQGPVVSACPLPASPLTSSSDESAPPVVTPNGDPLVVAVGSFEPRKNHLALLFAAEMLWREGVRFRLLLISGSAWYQAVTEEVQRLQAKGRPLESHVRVPDDEVVAAYRAARFSAMLSLHEGYGLPVAESLALGTPVLTSNLGSTAEIGAEGGTLMVDPYDDDAIIAGMRAMLTDDELIGRLRSEIKSRPLHTWTQYAQQLWQTVVEPELADVATS
jgi:glycosyltransferase involved in cell wall biosynthesis